jgi:hypothetical protein
VIGRGSHRSFSADPCAYAASRPSDTYEWDPSHHNELVMHRSHDAAAGTAAAVRSPIAAPRAASPRRVDARRALAAVGAGSPVVIAADEPS